LRSPASVARRDASTLRADVRLWQISRIAASFTDPWPPSADSSLTALQPRRTLPMEAAGAAG
jgi:hypothetical protein